MCVVDGLRVVSEGGRSPCADRPRRGGKGYPRPAPHSAQNLPSGVSSAPQ